MKYPQEIIEKIRDVAQISEVISEDVDLKPKGSNFVGLSPFNDEKTPSFVVSPLKRIYKDFSSGKSGNVITWYMEFHGMNFVEAVRALAKKYGVSLPDISTEKESQKYEREEAAYKTLKAAADYFAEKLLAKDGRIALKYFLNRGFTKEIISTFKLGYAPDSWNGLSDHLLKIGFIEENLIDAGLIIKKDSGGFYDRFRGRAMFTIRDFLGRPVGFGARRMNEDKDQPKYINSPQSLIYDKSKILYGLSEGKNAIRNAAEAILVEGYADVITLYQSGIENVVASSGTALTEQQVKLLKRYSKKLFIIYDSDKAGISAAEKGAEIALTNDLEPLIVRLPDGEDPDSLVKENGPKSLSFFLKDAMNFVDFIVDNRKKIDNYNTPSEKAELIRDITRIISKIPDKLQHHFYLRRTANLLELSEAQLQQVYEEKAEMQTKIQIHPKPKIKSTDDQKKSKIREEIKQFKEITIGDDLHKIPIYAAEELSKEELILFKLLLTKDNPENYIAKYDIIVDDLKSDLAKELFSTIYSIMHDNNDVFDTVVSGTELETTVRDILSSIAIPVFQISAKWSEVKRVNDTDPDLSIKDSINRLRLSKMIERLNEINDRLKDREGNVNEILREQLELNKKIQELDYYKYQEI